MPADPGGTEETATKAYLTYVKETFFEYRLEMRADALPQ